MKKLILILVCFIGYIGFSQTNYNKGFEDGYKEGWCYGKGIGCIPPIPPIPPIPRIGEDFENYQDGYNRGFQEGLDDGRKNQDSNGRSYGVKRERYETSSPVFVENATYRGGGGGGVEPLLAFCLSPLYFVFQEEEKPNVKAHLITKLDMNLTPKKIRKPSWSLLLEIKLKNKLFIESGITYSNNEIIIDESTLKKVIKESSNREDPNLYNREVSFKQYTFPLTIKYKLLDNVIVPKVGLYISNIVKSIDSIAIYYRSKSSPEIYKLKQNPFDIGVNLGLEIRICDFICDLVYKKGVNNIIEFGDTSFRNNNLYMGVGISF